MFLHYFCLSRLNWKWGNFDGYLPLFIYPANCPATSLPIHLCLAPRACDCPTSGSQGSCTMTILTSSAWLIWADWHLHGSPSYACWLMTAFPYFSSRGTNRASMSSPPSTFRFFASASFSLAHCSSIDPSRLRSGRHLWNWWSLMWYLIYAARFSFFDSR